MLVDQNHPQVPQVYHPYDEVITDPNNVTKFQNMRPLKNIKDIQSFLSFCNFYKKFIKDFTTIVYFFNVLLYKGTPFL